MSEKNNNEDIVDRVRQTRNIKFSFKLSVIALAKSNAEKTNNL